jgi:hypothetical protein
MLHQTGIYNRFTPEFIKEISDRIDGFPDTVHYIFDLKRENLDKDKYNGAYTYPNQYTLDPATFRITDKYEKRPGEQKLKYVGIPKGEVDDKGNPTAFKKIVVHERQKGKLSLRKEDEDDLAMIWILELHPKQKGGLFGKPELHQIFYRVDEAKENTEKRAKRTQRVLALQAAQSMSDKELRQFEDAMQWNRENDIEILKGKIEELADTTPDFFNEFIKGKSMEYQATIKRALDSSIIAFDPTNNSFQWCANNAPFASVALSDEQNEVAQLAVLLQTGGSKMEEVYKKIKAQLQPDKKETAGANK